MLNNKINQSGFHATALIAVVCVVSLIGLVGLRLFNLQSKSTVEGQSVGQADSALPVPVGWAAFADKNIGVQFIYPAAFGTFRKQVTPTEINAQNVETTLTSGQPDTAYVPGVTGNFTVKTYKKGVIELQSARFGPTIKLVNDEWIVTEANQNDPKHYKKGQIYEEISTINARGLNVYTSPVLEEGVVTYHLYFMTNGRLHELQLPPFDSELDTSTYNVNDQGPYNTMYQQVRDSLSLY